MRVNETDSSLLRFRVEGQFHIHHWFIRVDKIDDVQVMDETATVRSEEDPVRFLGGVELIYSKRRAFMRRGIVINVQGNIGIL